jgi:hypothetical protein
MGGGFSLFQVKNHRLEAGFCGHLACRGLLSMGRQFTAHLHFDG